MATKQKNFKPMLAGKFDIEKAKWPLLATPKIDGIRCLTFGSKLVSRTLKEIPNKYIQAALSDLPNGLDGELFVEGGFNATSSLVMSHDKPLEDINLTYYVFDCIWDPKFQYVTRLSQLKKQFNNKSPFYMNGVEIKLLAWPKEVGSANALIELQESYLKQGFEGTMVRVPDGPYKFGRSTTNQGWLLKVKQFEDDEAIVVGFKELQRHVGPTTLDNLGHTERDSKKENMAPGNTLGALVCEHPKYGSFDIGTGFTAALRQHIWDAQNIYDAKTVKFKYFEITPDGKPRFPVFLGVRDLIDMG